MSDRPRNGSARRGFIWLAAIVMAMGAFGLFARGRGIAALRHRPMPFEARISRAAWRWMIPGEVRHASNPVPASQDLLKGAREHWADHCAICHDNDGSGETAIGPRLYPPVPDLRASATQSLTDGELFYAIERGIPWTGMPGWATGTADGERESWALVRLVRHLPAITPQEIQEMERLNPKPPVNEEREKEIDDFLKGAPKGGRGGRS